jgi:hypothetical protein
LQLLPDAAAQEEDGEVAAIDDFFDQVICCGSDVLDGRC